MRPKHKSNSSSEITSLHRLQDARLNAGVSLRALSLRMKVTVSQAKAEEEGERDLSITDLHRWQQALNIPLEELLVPPTTSLSEPIRQRACMIRAGKTAKTLLKTCQGVRNQRLARRLMDQLVELMPELAEVGAWPEGTLRSRDELGRGAYPVITGDWTNPLTTY